MCRERSHGRLRRWQQRRWPRSKKTILTQHSGRCPEDGDKKGFFNSLSEHYNFRYTLRTASLELAAYRQSRACGFCGKNFRLRDVRRLRKKIFGFGKKSFGDLSVKVSVAPIFIGECVKDAVLSRPQFNCVPTDCGGFPFRPG